MPRPAVTKGDVERAVRGAIDGGLPIGSFAIHVERGSVRIVPWQRTDDGYVAPADQDEQDCRAALRRASQRLSASDFERKLAGRNSLTKLEAEMLLDMSDRLIRAAELHNLLERQSPRGAVRYTRHALKKALGWL